MKISPRPASTHCGFRLMLLLRLFVFVIAVLAAACSPQHKTSGQIFVVTRGRENIKMGLVPVYVAPAEQLKPIAADLLKRLNAVRLDKLTTAQSERLNQEELARFGVELQAMIRPGHAIPEIDLLSRECNARSLRAADSLLDTEKEKPAEIQLVSALLFKSLPEPQGKSDADGRFTVQAKRGDWLLATASRAVGNQEESYFWVCPVLDNVTMALLSNDSQLEGISGIRDFLQRAAGVSTQPPVAPRGGASPAVLTWVNESRTKAKEAIAAYDAKQIQIADEKRMAAEQAALDAKAEAEKARLLTEEFAQRAAKTRIAQIEGDLHRCGFSADMVTHAINTGGKIAAWGSNVELRYAAPNDLNGVVAVSVGWRHAVALKRDGTIVVWGTAEGNTSIPAGMRGVTAVAAGDHHTAVLKEDGTVQIWRSGTEQTRVPESFSSVTAIAAGANHTVALRKDGTVVSCSSDISATGDAANNIPAGLFGVVAISAGGNSSIALKADGTVVAWGDNSSGQCTIPRGLKDVVSVSMGAFHVIALKADGTVVAWGGNLYKQCDVPAGLKDIVAVSAGWMNTGVVKKDGSVITWGGWACGETPHGLTGVFALSLGHAAAVAVRSE